ncbi:response regulator transcription factor [Thermasporomyces composti]|uniref:DNA-binding response OmpR family regulator n=1 Tax=Thermasporomyces composti TaxID=696763 RepID=A0A3D9V9D5_THECX|nr:response regulator transcription factor [Thermasporomyces composti]REF36770.1 DNA-binding response OmpR family regulator [Thermasporomyces composti]
MSRILVVEDEPAISDFVVRGLREHGFAAAAVTNGAAALHHAATGEFDLLLLDIGLPDRDGFSVIRQLRASRNDIPVVVLSARDSVTDTVKGLEIGADDYVCKPFRFEELLARIRLRLRDARMSSGMLMRNGELVLDLRTRRAYVDGRTVELTTREFLLAELFFRRPGEVISREELLSHVWGYDFDPGSNVVDVYIRYLRRKIGAEHIETVRGVGYRLVRR